ncbi:MAG: DUF3050 domain-containing protein [Planctomycetaceae bacterium]|jgi:hypothetical protein
MSRFAALQGALQPCRQNLLRHPLYDQLSESGRLRQFLEHHVFAVWDFMSLLKVLQRELCGTQIPWTPPRSTSAARLINEIVTGEESDLHPAGGYASHFQLYREAMQQFGADTWAVDQLVQSLRQGASLADALANPGIPAGARRFVKTTFTLIDTGDLPRIAGAFALGREILIPDMFRRIVQGLNQELGGGLTSLLYYLDRHIELDGGAHGAASEQLICELCGSDPQAWQQAQDGALTALQARLRFWDDIMASFAAAEHQPSLVPSH